MKPSEQFSSMEEVKEYVKSFKDFIGEKEYESLKELFGLGNQIGDYVIIAGIGKIDKSISKLIELLNKKGFITLACCSGLKKEHLNKADNIKGYISFWDYDKEKKKIIKNIAKLCKFSFIDNNETYLKPSFAIEIKTTDKIMGEKWDKVYEYILKL